MIGTFPRHYRRQSADTGHTCGRVSNASPLEPGN
jgi:hypothetical protein